MRCRPPIIALALLCVAAALPGCAPQQPLYFRDSNDLSHYVGVAAQLENPDIPEQPNSEVAGTIRPFSIDRAAPTNMWDLKLEEVMKIALENAKVMRTIGGQVSSPPSFLTSNPNGAPTIYDPAITETDARFGINAGLSLFDPTWTTDIFWERNHEPLNVNQLLVSEGVSPGELSQDVFQFQSQVVKTTPTGLVMTLGNSTSYLLARDNPTLEFPSDWQTSFQMKLRQPLLQGAGVEYNEIAGPGAIPGFNQGVLIARVNTDIALTTFEGSVRNLVSSVETTYWELYYAYRNKDAAEQGRDSALRTWQIVYSKFKQGVKGGEAASEAQAREQFFVFKAAAEQAQLQLYQTEANLRYMMGIAATDGRLIRPEDDPTTAKISFDWEQVEREAMSRSVEIREARWRVKQRDLELIAAKNYLLPRVDLDARYRWLGLGDKLIDQGNSSTSGGAFDNLGSGEFQDWHIGISAQVPLGFRKQMSGVNNAEMAIARDQAKLRETELEVSHQVAFAVRDMEANFLLTETNFNRLNAAKRNVDAVRQAYEDGTVEINVLLDAQRSRAQAESEYYRSLTNYAKAVSQVHFRKGTLLEYNGVYLTEGPWPAKAYFDARRRARARSAATYFDYGFTYPRVLSKGPAQQFSGQPMAAEETPLEGPNPLKPGQPSGPAPEEVPTPPPGEREPAPSMPLGPPASAQPVPPTETASYPPQPARKNDIGSLDLSGLAPRAQQAAVPSLNGVQPASYHE